MKKPNFLSFFEKKVEQKNKERDERELLRENLALVPIDIYYVDDPLLGIPPDKREVYLKKFHDLCEDKEIMEWFKYLINKQARTTLQMSMNGESDQAGAFNINGIATVRDMFLKLAQTYNKEHTPKQDFNKYSITS